MKKFLPIGLIVCIILIGTDASSQTEKDYDINTAMMKATFKIEGRTAQGQPTIGTAFVMGRPYPHPPVDQPQKARYVLITAAHVLNEMQGDTAILHLRRKGSMDNWVRIPFPITIRASGQGAPFGRRVHRILSVLMSVWLKAFALLAFHTPQ
jgi:hypothetical protein